MTAGARSILVAYDGSDAGRDALDAAADLAGYGSTVSVAVVPGNGNGSDPGRLLHEARDHLLRRHVLARFLDPAGDPADAIVETAGQLRVDLIVVARGDGLRPSLSADVGRRAPCDVFIVS